MIRTLIRFLRGYVRIRVEGYSPERFLNLCSYHQLLIWGLQPSGNGYEMYMSIDDFRKLRPLAGKTHTKVKLTGRCGFPFFVQRYRYRKLFFAGLLLCVVLLKLYSLFIWDIRFEGNVRWTDENLAAFLESGDVAPLMLKSEVDCPGIVKNIRKAYNDIVWVSASVDGSLLKIQIKENDDTFPQGETGNEKDSRKEAREESGQQQEDTDVADADHPVDLVASKSGVITEIVTRAGIPQVHAGDTVEEGDILVLGRVDVVNDAGETVGYQYVNADADISADTQMEYSDSIPLICQEKVYDGKVKYQPFLKVFDRVISVGSVKNSYPHSDLYTEERELKAGENFYLPLSFGMRTARSYSFEERKYTQDEIREILTRNFQRFCRELEERGTQIRENSVKINLHDDSADAVGTLYLTEDIAATADTEILTIERKETDESVGTDN